LAAETARREDAERQVDEHGQRERQLEAELAQTKQAQERLSQDLGEAQTRLRELQESSGAEQTRLETRTRELQSANIDIEAEVRRLTERLAAEMWRREGAEQQAEEIGLQRSELEVTAKETQARLQCKLETAHQQLQAHQEKFGVEQTRFESRVQELQSAKFEVEREVDRLTGLLIEENKRRGGVEQEAAEYARRGRKLESELAETREAKEQLRQRLEESQNQFETERERYVAEQAKLHARTRELEALTAELASVRNRVEMEALQCRKLAEKVVEVQRAKVALAAQSETASATIRAHEESIRSLDSQVRKRQSDVEKLESLLQSETAQRRRDQSQIEAVEKQAADLNSQLAEKIAEQHKAQQRAAELEQCVNRLREQLVATAAAATIQDVELTRLKNAIEDLRVIETALCAKVRELTAKDEAAAKRIQELGSQRQQATKTIQERDRELAGLRHAILDAARIGSSVSHERREAESQVVDGWKRMIGTLLQTPLSTSQRGLVGEIISALDGWRKGRAGVTTGFDVHVEPPALYSAEFNCAEVVEGAFESVRKNADKAGVKVRTAIVGPVPRSLHGNAQNIHQLITMLAASLPEVGCVEYLEFVASIEVKQSGGAELQLSLLVSPTGDDGTMCVRLTTLTETSATLRTLRCGGPELELTSAWQLALAMGGVPSIEAVTDGKVLVQIALPLEATATPASRSASNDPVSAAPNRLVPNLTENGH
jgi:chromosome segregation ATPase